jgi:hypothetical protein
MNYIVANPTAISDMNQAMVDVTNIASGLTGLTAAQATALSSLPSDMLSTLVCAASAAGLALRVSSTMNNKYAKKNGYGNEITSMMDEYMRGETPDEDELEDDLEDEEDYDDSKSRGRR